MAEAFVALGVVSMACGSVGLLYSFTSGSSYLSKLKSARPATTTTSSSGLVYLSGSLQCPNPVTLRRLGIEEGAPGAYAALFKETSEVWVSKTIQQDEKGQRRATHERRTTMLALYPYIADKVTINGWDVAAFIPLFKTMLVGNFQGPAPVVSPAVVSPSVGQSQSINNTPSITIVNGNNNNGNGNDDAIGEQNRQVIGYVHKVTGVPLGRFYTIFGSLGTIENAEGVRKSVLLPSGNLIFADQTAQQVIDAEEASLLRVRLISGIAFGVGALCTAVPLVVSRF